MQSFPRCSPGRQLTRRLALGATVLAALSATACGAETDPGAQLRSATTPPTSSAPNAVPAAGSTSGPDALSEVVPSTVAGSGTAGDPTTTAAEPMNTDPMKSMWPRPWDPAQPINFSGVPGVTAEQQQRAEDLVAKSLADLPQFADVDSLAALGYNSIGDASSGYEHYVNFAMLLDEYELDPNHPESLVYKVDGDQRTLASAMFMVNDTAVDDPRLTDYAGPLMQWHVHTDLCFAIGPDGPYVAALQNVDGSCPAGSSASVLGEQVPMVHVWVLPHECGPFAALEGVAAGEVDEDTTTRMDQCHSGHDENHTEGA